MILLHLINELWLFWIAYAVSIDALGSLREFKVVPDIYIRIILILTLRAAYESSRLLQTILCRIGWVLEAPRSSTTY